MSGARARVAQYAPKDDTLAGLLEHARIVSACNARYDQDASTAARMFAMRSHITRTAEDLFRVSMVAQARAQEALERHDAEAEGAIREVAAAADEARDAVIKLRTEIRLSGTDPDAHPTDELVRATEALTSAEQHASNIETRLAWDRGELEAAWAAAARQCVQDGVMLFGSLVRSEEDLFLGNSGLDSPLPKNVRGSVTFYPLPVYELHEVTHREKPAQRYEAGAAP